MCRWLGGLAAQAHAPRLQGAQGGLAHLHQPLPCRVHARPAARPPLPSTPRPQGKHRVDIKALQPNSTDISGGYILDNEHGKAKQARLGIQTLPQAGTCRWAGQRGTAGHAFCLPSHAFSPPFRTGRGGAAGAGPLAHPVPGAVSQKRHAGAHGPPAGSVHGRRGAGGQQAPCPRYAAALLAAHPLPSHLLPRAAPSSPLQAQQDYISGYLRSFEAALFGGSAGATGAADSNATGWRALANESSAIDFFLLEVLPGKEGSVQPPPAGT